jgi:hypothetical protein
VKPNVVGGESMDDQRLEHVKMLQAAIARMAQNSFLLKGWSVSLATGILAVALAEKRQAFAWLGLLPAFAFWGLDSFYLRQEKLFRSLHDDVCTAFGSSAPVMFGMNTASVSSPPASWWRLLFNRTVVGIHAPLLAVILATALLMNRDALAAVWRCATQNLGGGN